MNYSDFTIEEAVSAYEAWGIATVCDGDLLYVYGVI